MGWGYKYGMAVANWEWLVWPAQGLLLFFFLPVYLKNRIFTIPEYLTRRFGRLAGSAFALVCMIQYLVINLPLVLYSGGFAINKVSDGNRADSRLGCQEAPKSLRLRFYEIRR